MARFKIYSADGSTVRYEGTLTYNGTYLKASYLEFSDITSPVPIPWEVGDYVYYPRTGLTYRLYYLPQPKKIARRGEYGSSFIYSSVQFHAATKQLEIAPFRDIVTADNLHHFSTLNDVNTFENVPGIARRIQACMDDLYPGKWEIRVLTQGDADLIEQMNTAREFSVSGGSCMSALDSIYDTWENVGWIHSYDSATGRDILTIGAANVRTVANTTEAYGYGMGKGLKSLTKNISNRDEMATRLYVYGNYTNMTPRYYNGKDIVDAESVDIQNLMLPLSVWGRTGGKPDAQKSYLQADAATVKKFGLIPKTVYFDGSENEDIYPSLSGVTAGEIRAAKSEAGDTEYVPSTAAYPDAERIDRIKVGSNLQDDGVQADNGKAFAEEYNISVPAKFETDRQSTGEAGTASIVLGLFSADFDYQGRKKVTVTPDLQAYICKGDGFTQFSYVNSPYVEFVFNDRSGNEYPAMIKDCALLFDNTQVSANGTRYMGQVYEIPSYIISVPDGYTHLEVRFKAECYVTSPSAVIPHGCYAGSAFLGARTIHSGTFEIRLKQIGFDLNKRAALSSEGRCSISMLDGMCAGRTFVVKGASYVRSTDEWALEVYRGFDESIGMYYPNRIYPIAANDAFVLLDLSMPDLYIGIAEQRLLARGRELLSRLSRVMPAYEPEIDPKFMVDTGRTLREGLFMKLEDADVIGSGYEYVLIDSLSIVEGDSLPSYRVTLREEKKVSFQQATNAAISSVTRMVTEGNTTVSNSENEQVTSYSDLEDIPVLEGTRVTGVLSAYKDFGILTTNFFDFAKDSGQAVPPVGTRYNLYSLGEVAAYGIGGPVSPGPSGVGGLLTEWNYTADKSDYALGANLGAWLKERIDAIGSGGTDVQWSSGLSSGQVIGTLTIDGKANVLYAPQQKEVSLENLTGADDLKAIESLSGGGLLRRDGEGSWRLDTSYYLTSNQTITLRGDISGSGSTSITATIGQGKVLNSMLAGGIANSKLENSDVTIGKTRLALGSSTNSISFNNSGELLWAATDGKSAPMITFTSANLFMIGDKSYGTTVNAATLTLNGQTQVLLQRAGENYINLNAGQVRVSKDITMADDARRIYFGDTSHYIEWTGSYFKFSHMVSSNAEVSAYGRGEADENNTRSLGGLLNVDWNADESSTENCILIRSSGDLSWRKVKVSDVFNFGVLRTARMTTSYNGVQGQYLVLEFTTGDSVYCDLSQMSAAALSELRNRLTTSENRIAAMEELVNDVKSKTDRVFYSESEWELLTHGDTDYSNVPDGMIYIYEEEEEPTSGATYDGADGRLTLDGQYDSTTGVLRLNGSYDSTTGNLTI